MKKKRRAKRGDLVLVRWIDSCTPVRKWHHPDMMDEYRVAECLSVGWLGRRDKETLVLAASLASEEVGEVSAIPASCVKSVEVLRRKDEV